MVCRLIVQLFSWFDETNRKSWCVCWCLVICLQIGEGGGGLSSAHCKRSLEERLWSAHLGSATQVPTASAHLRSAFEAPALGAT